MGQAHANGCATDYETQPLLPTAASAQSADHPGSPAGLLVIGFLAYCWHLGGPQPIRAVEKPVAAERLGR